MIISQSNKPLYFWIEYQRKNEEKLSSEKIRKLDEVCEHWRVYNKDAEWELKLVELKEWKTEQIVSLTFMVYQHIVNRLVFLLNALRPCVICRHTRRGGTSSSFHDLNAHYTIGLITSVGTKRNYPLRKSANSMRCVSTGEHENHIREYYRTIDLIMNHETMRSIEVA